MNILIKYDTIKRFYKRKYYEKGYNAKFCI